MITDTEARADTVQNLAGIAVVASRKTDDVGDELGGLVRPNLGKVRLTFEHDEQAVQQVTTAVIGHRVRAHLQAAIPQMAVDNAGSSSDLIVSVACMRVKPGRIHAAGQPGGKRHARALEGPIDEADYGLPRFRSCRFAAAYPLGQVELADPDLPVTAVVQGFNPLIPGDVGASSIPAAILVTGRQLDDEERDDRYDPEDDDHLQKSAYDVPRHRCVRAPVAPAARQPSLFQPFGQALGRLAVTLAAPRAATRQRCITAARPAPRRGSLRPNTTV